MMKKINVVELYRKIHREDVKKLHTIKNLHMSITALTFYFLLKNMLLKLSKDKYCCDT